MTSLDKKAEETLQLAPIELHLKQRRIQAALKEAEAQKRDSETAILLLTTELRDIDDEINSYLYFR